jgi:radical SAM protein with 4Fe4S-binding SPASM domain
MPWILGEGAYAGAGIVPSEANLAALTRTYGEAIDASLASLESPDLADTVLLSQLDDAIRAAASGAPQLRRTHLCPAGSGTLSVGADGRVSPCFMFTGKPAFELGDVAAFDDAAFETRRAAFVRQVEVPPDATFEIRAACAGQNHEVSGAVGEVSAASLLVQAAIAEHLRGVVGALVADPNRWSWVQCKLLLHQLEAGGPFEAAEC